MKNIFKQMSFLLITIFGSMLLFQMSASAVQLNFYNGASLGTGNRPTGGCAEGQAYNYWCRTPDIFGVRISFVYYDGSKYEQLGNTIDIFKSTVTPKGKQTNPYYYKHTGQFDNSKVVTPTARTQYHYGSAAEGATYLWSVMSEMPASENSGNAEAAFWQKKLLTEALDEKQYVKKGSLVDQLAIKLTGHTLVREELNKNKDTFWDRPSEKAVPSGGGLNKKGYRILIEPLRTLTGQDGNVYVLTPTEYASTVWNTGVRTTQSQVKYYLGLQDRMFTVFDDIGLHASGSCRNKYCLASDVQISGRKGHGVHIIDITDQISKKCDYETGEGFPEKFKTLEQLGRELTPQEKACCDEKKEELNQPLPTYASARCMTTTSTVPAYATCVFNYLNNGIKQAQLMGEIFTKKTEFETTYPACFDGGDTTPLICKYFGGTYYGINGSPVTPQKYIEECGPKADRKCKIVDSNGTKIYYGKNGSVVDEETYERECKGGNTTNGCDDKNPNHFPTSCNSTADLTCCKYFEQKMEEEFREEAVEKFGMTGNTLKNYVDNKVNEWFYEPGYEFRQNCLCEKCDINADRLTEDCCEELREQYPDKSEEFWTSKGCPLDPNKCKWKDYEVTDIGRLNTNANCKLNSTTKAEDTNNWECIFESDNIEPGTKVEPFKDYYLKYNNPYCSVYCRESVQYNFPNDDMVTRAGNHFTVGNTGKLPEWSPVKFTSTRECRTSGSTRVNDSTTINTEQFEKDWAETNDRVVSTWDAWKIEEQLDYSYSHSRKGAKDCDWRCTRRCRSCSTDSEGKRHCSSYCCESKPFGYTMYPASVSYATFGQSSKDITPSSWCSTDGHPEPNPAEKKATHEQAKKDLDNIERDISSCTSWDNFGTYRYATFNHTDVKSIRYSKYDTYNDFLNYKEFSPDLTIDYQEPTDASYSYNDQLKKQEKTTVTDHNFSTSGASMTVKYQCTERSAPYKTTCTKSRVFNYSKQTETHAKYTKTVDYKLKDNVFNVILKPQGTPVMGSEKGSDSDQVYIDLGYSALHNHFMTPSGRYDIGLSYNKFTPATGNNNHTHNFDQFISTSTKNYSCQYRVINEIIENKDPNCEGDNCIACGSDNCLPDTLRGLNLIYRTIALSNPFPGVTGTGREAGSNWENADDIKNYITNNRNTKADRVYYDKAPMYQITLSPAVIKKIREYNNTTNFNDFNMDCLESNGRECKSDFIRGKLEGNNYNFSSYFNNCAYSGGKGTTKCCGIGNWNDCDNNDGITRRK